jgi:hypothetical protein
VSWSRCGRGGDASCTAAMGIRQRGAAFLRDDLSGVVSEMANYFDGRASEAVLRHGRTERGGGIGR